MLSIITPVLNGAEFIESNIQEILKLNISFEHIIVDGGSTDNTINIVMKFPHIILLHQMEKTGMYGAIHQGIINSKGEQLAYVNADDKIIVAGYEQMYNYISKTNVDVVYSDSMLLYSKSNKIVKHFGKRFAKFFLKHGILPFIQPSSIFSKSLYFKVGGFRFDKFRICGDLDLFYRFASLPETNFFYIRGFSSLFLVRDDSLGNLNSEVVYQEKTINNIPIPSLIVRLLYKLSLLIQLNSI